ncbi:MAG: hypothetical protein AB8E15_05060 [Bdellovibrionales bacterium]
MQVIVTGVVIFMIVALFATYAFLAIFYPEWVGITGKKAKEIESKHREIEGAIPEEIEEL